uniref:Alpha-1,3-mannosyl-glycoprotein 2-beta-N-acetylglucosaminyltransferase n=1 Tax=Scylla olivacea TaxID=85551 RepID=A0A0P4VZL2_SCYOL
MMTKGFLEEVYHKWKAPDKNHDWDIWFRSTEVRAGRECVVPDVSRTFHGGMEGAHINGIMTHAHFTAHPVTNVSYVKLNVERMTQTAYEEDLYKTLEGSNVYYLDNVHHPCSEDYVPKNFTDGPVVIFFSMTSKDHHLGWKKMGACLGVWNLDPRSNHRGLFRLTYYGTDLYLIGFPYSDYSYLRGAHTHVVVDPKEEEEYILGQRTLENRAHYKVEYLEKLAPYLAVDGRRVDKWMSQDDKHNPPLHLPRYLPLPLHPRLLHHPTTHHKPLPLQPHPLTPTKPRKSPQKTRNKPKTSNLKISRSGSR